MCKHFTSLQIHVWPIEFAMCGIVCHPRRTHLAQALCATFVGNHGKRCDLCWGNRLTLGVMTPDPSVIAHDSCSHGEQRSVAPNCALNKDFFVSKIGPSDEPQRICVLEAGLKQ